MNDEEKMVNDLAYSKCIILLKHIDESLQSKQYVVYSKRLFEFLDCVSFISVRHKQDELLDNLKFLQGVEDD